MDGRISGLITSAPIPPIREEAQSVIPNSRHPLPPIREESVQIVRPNLVQGTEQNNRVGVIPKKPLIICGIILIGCAIGALVFAIVLSCKFGKMNRMLIATAWVSVMLIITGSISIKITKTTTKRKLILKIYLVLAIVSAFCAFVGLIVAINDSKLIDDEDKLTQMFDDDNYDHDMDDHEKMFNWNDHDMDRDHGKDFKRKEKRDNRHWHEDYQGLEKGLVIVEAVFFFIAFITAIVMAGFGCRLTCKCCKAKRQNTTQVFYLTLPPTAIRTVSDGQILQNQRLPEPTVFTHIPPPALHNLHYQNMAFQDYPNNVTYGPPPPYQK